MNGGFVVRVKYIRRDKVVFVNGTPFTNTL